MKKFILSALVVILPVYLLPSGKGVRGAFTRNCFIGSEYIAAGRSCEASVDDVFSVYWNPAGLVRLYNKKYLSSDEIRVKAEKNEIDDISEEDIRRMNEDTARAFVQTGATVSSIDVERRSVFAAVAFKFFSGAMAIGGYVINSPDIDRRDEAGVYKGKTSYSAGVSYFSYAFKSSIANFGFTFKGLGENIDGTQYFGAAGDIGAQFSVFPILRIGVVAQDLGIFMKGGSIDGKKYDFGSSLVRAGISVSNAEQTIIITVSSVRKLEDETFEYNMGLTYNMEFVSLMIGLADKNLTAGARISVLDDSFELSYALSIDPVDLGYNNTISVSAAF